MTVYEGWKLRRARQREGIALDAIGHAMGMTYIAVAQLEDSIIVSEQMGSRYLQAVSELRPTSRALRRHYRREYNPSRAR